MTALNRNNFGIPIAAIAAGFLCVVLLSNFLDRNRSAVRPEYSDADLSLHGSLLKGFLLGAEGLAADWYWMRSLQYIGAKIVNAKTQINIDDLRELNPRLLYPYLQNVTDLDPHYIAAYSYGAMVLPAIDPEKAIAIAQKGIANNPSEWRLYQHLGYTYWKLKRYDEAAQAYEAGSHIPGAAGFMKLMAASMKTEGGSRATSRIIYREMLAQPGEEHVRVTAVRHLRELDSLDEREAIDSVLGDFKARYGRCPDSFSEITGLLLSAKLPEGREFRVDDAGRLIDPTDAPYVLDRENCRTMVDVSQTGSAQK